MKTKCEIELRKQINAQVHEIRDLKDTVAALREALEQELINKKKAMQEVLAATNNEISQMKAAAVSLREALEQGHLAIAFAPQLELGGESMTALTCMLKWNDPALGTVPETRALEAAAAARGVRLACHLKIDTGMNRLGFRHDNLRRTLPALLASPALELDAVYTHFATADDPEASLRQQRAASAAQRDGQFIGTRQLFEVPQRELLEELRGGAVQQRSIPSAAGGHARLTSRVRGMDDTRSRPRRARPRRSPTDRQRPADGPVPGPA